MIFLSDVRRTAGGQEEGSRSPTGSVGSTGGTRRRQNLLLHVNESNQLSRLAMSKIAAINNSLHCRCGAGGDPRTGFFGHSAACLFPTESEAVI